VQAPALVRGRPDLPAAIEQVFAIIENGWNAAAVTSVAGPRTPHRALPEETEG
jgi:hypothetical protein